METRLSNNLGLQISNNGELLGMDLDFSLPPMGDFLCFAGKVGSVSSEQEYSWSPQIGSLVNKNLFPSPQIFVLCIYMATSCWTPQLSGYKPVSRAPFFSDFQVS